MLRNFSKPSLLLIFLLAISCTRSPIKNSDEALRVVEKAPELKAEVLDEVFLKDLTAHIEFWQSRTKLSSKTLKFGPKSIGAQDYMKALMALKTFLETNADPAQRRAYLEQNFVFMEVFGRSEWGEIFMTSYFSPVLEGRLKPEGVFTQPLYARPSDLVEVDLKAFAERSTLASFENPAVKTQLPDILRGRLIVESAHSSIPRIEPYYSREEIEAGKLSGKKLELFYVDPIEASILQIQGSGTLKVPGQPDVYMVYDGQNGHRYEAIGKFLLDVIPKEQMSLHRIESHLRTLPPAQLKAVLNKNPSFVFFKKSTQAATTSFGITAQPGRTIATDTRYFPKGALALLEFKAPHFAGDTDVEPKEFVPTQRLVFDHDTGGAIKGAGRLDFYWGEGPMARRASGVIKDTGRLLYLFPRSAL